MKNQPTKKQPKATKKQPIRKPRAINPWGRWYFALPAALIVILLVGYLGRGWIRTTFEPAALSFTAGHSVSSTLDQQLTALGDPLNMLGIKDTQRSNECRLSLAVKLHSEIYCSSTMNGYARLPADQLANLAATSEQLEKGLKANGWTGYNTSISTLGKNIGQGIDYTPDAAYQKNVGKITCMVDFNTAFSKPRPAAINGTINCYRTVYIWGGAKCPAGNISYLDRTGHNLLWTDCSR